MRPVSNAFLRSLTGSHPVVSRATVCTTFQTGTTPTGNRVQIINGDVTLDGRADVRGSVDLTLAESWPLFIDSDLAPYGNEIYVERGIQLTDAQVEYVGLGYFRIETPEQEELRGPVRVTAYDRMQAIVEGRLLAPRQYESGTTFGFIVEELVTEIYPDATIEWDDTTDISTLTRDVIIEEDRFAFLNDAITSRGKIWFWDHRGVLVIKDVPDPTDPVYTVTHETHGNLINAQRTLTREDTWNAVVALGEALDDAAPVRGLAIDDDPSSPTYFFGRFGQKPKYYSSPFLTTENQAADAAAAMLARELGLTYRVSFGSIVNPALEPYDPITLKVSYDEPRQIHVLDVVRIPLHTGGVQESDTREQRVTLASSS